MKDIIKLSDYPFVAEKMAIDSLNSLLAAEVGIRAYRDRGFFTRVFDFFTGDDAELQAQINVDLLTSQRATLHIVKQLIFEETRTKKCLSIVADKLHLAIEKLNLHTVQINEIYSRMGVAENNISNLFERMTDVETDLKNQIDRIDFNQQRSTTIRHLGAHFRAGHLHKGLSPILQSALFVAQISNLFADTDNHDEEVEYARSVVAEKISKNTAPIETVIIEDIEKVSSKDLFIVIGYITTQREKPLSVMYHSVAQRQLSNLVVDEQIIRDGVTISGLYDNNGFLHRNILSSPYELATQLAFELANT